MTDREKLEKIKELADAMYYGGQQLTTDASMLHNAMDEYHKFVINEYHKKEPVSEDLKKAARKYAGIPEDSPHDLKYCVQDKKAKYDAVLYGANLQKLYDMGLTEKAEMKTVSELFNSETDELKRYAIEIAFMMLPATCTQSYHDTNRVRIIDAVIHGAQWQKEQLLAKAIDAVVKIDAGGYPYVDATIELYDYVKDMPLAKEGDKYKVIVIKED